MFPTGVDRRVAVGFRDPQRAFHLVRADPAGGLPGCIEPNEECSPVRVGKRGQGLGEQVVIHLGQDGGAGSLTSACQSG